MMCGTCAAQDVTWAKKEAAWEAANPGKAAQRESSRGRLDRTPFTRFKFKDVCVD